MIVKCDKCGKKYKIDAEKIAGEKARIKCKSCHAMLEIKKPRPADEKKYSFEDLDSMAPAQEQEPLKKTRKKRAPSHKLKEDDIPKGPASFKGLTMGTKFFLIFLLAVVIMTSFLTYAYLKYVPSLITQQISLRTLCISRSVSTAVLHPLLVRDYLRINQVAENNSKLPGVAYVAVVNKKGVTVAGIFSDLEAFSPDFVINVKKQGFPKEIPLKNYIPQGKNESSKELIIGGQEIHDVAVTIGATGGVVHIGTFVRGTEKFIFNTIKPLFTNLATLIVIGLFLFFIIAKIITKPIKHLAIEARRISLGNTINPVMVKGSGELKMIADALEKIRAAMQSEDE